MRKIVVSAVALAVSAAPAAALAQEQEDSTRIGDVAEQMSDPANQHQMAMMLAAMSEILLDMPLAPMMEAVAEAAGEDPRSVDPDTTLRSMAPGAGRVSQEIAEQTPRMMRAMGGMARGMDKMAPAMRDMARRMRDAMPPMHD